MPFGLRVSGHKSNIKLYKSFADKLEDLLKKDGRAFLFTQEKTLIREVLEKKFKILKEENIETGGLCPALFILERADK
jgi:23S rRNA G2445 N2-methylase RlmL